MSPLETSPRSLSAKNRNTDPCQGCRRAKLRVPFLISYLPISWANFQKPKLVRNNVQRGMQEVHPTGYSVLTKRLYLHKQQHPYGSLSCPKCTLCQGINQLWIDTNERCLMMERAFLQIPSRLFSQWLWRIMLANFPSSSWKYECIQPWYNSW